MGSCARFQCHCTDGRADGRGSEIKGDVYRTFRFRRVGSLNRAERETEIEGGSHKEKEQARARQSRQMARMMYVAQFNMI